MHDTASNLITSNAIPTFTSLTAVKERYHLAQGLTDEEISIAIGFCQKCIKQAKAEPSENTPAYTAYEDELTRIQAVQNKQTLVTDLMHVINLFVILEQPLTLHGMHEKKSQTALQKLSTQGDELKVSSALLSQKFAAASEALTEYQVMQQQIDETKFEILATLKPFTGGVNEVMDYIKEELQPLLDTGLFSQADFNRAGHKKIIKALHNYASLHEVDLSKYFSAEKPLQDPNISIDSEMLKYIGTLYNSQQVQQRRKRPKK